MKTNNSEKLEKLIEVVHAQNTELAEMRVLTKQNSEILKTHAELLAKLVENSTKNTIDLEYHIKRTDILQSYVTKLMYVGVAAIGAASVQFGPTLIKWVIAVF